jgi:3-oxoacyl-[acyl-carrier protein] reductase
MKKVILICGASKNLGKFLAERFSERSNVVLKISRSLKTDINKNIYQCDLSLYSDTSKIMQIIKKKHKVIDAIIYCAGSSSPFFNKKNTIDNFLDSFKNNFFSFISLIDNYLKTYKNKKTNIIVISSIAGVKPMEAPIEYSVSKAALNFYCKIRSKQLIQHDIKLNVISPGNILMSNNNWAKKIKINKRKVMNYISKNVPARKFISPEEIYEICKMLIIKDKLNIFGSNLIIDGGQTL